MVQKTTGTVPLDIKVQNREKILRIYADGKVKTPNEVSEMIQLSRQTVSKAIEYFVNKKLLVLAGKGKSSEVGGRRPKNYELSHDICFTAVNAEENAVHFTLFNLYGEHLFSHTEEIVSDPSYEEFRHVIKAGAEKICGHLSSDQVMEGVSLTIRGLVDSERKLLRYSPYYTKWERNQSLEELIQYFPGARQLTADKPVRTYARCLLNKNMEEFQDQRVLVLFSRGGMAGATIDHGHIDKGRNSIIGEFSTMIVNFEKNLAAGGLIRMQDIARYAKEYKEINPNSILLKKKDITYQELCAAAEAGDVLAEKAMEYLARCFGALIRNINLTFDAERIIFIGEYASFQDRFMELLKKELQTFIFYPNGYAPALIRDDTPLEEMLVEGAILNMFHEYYKREDLYMD